MGYESIAHEADDKFYNDKFYNNNNDKFYNKALHTFMVL